MKERNNRVLIIEGTQGSGKTTAAGHLATLGCKSFRGIPTGEELASNCEAQNWKQSNAIFEMAANDSDGSTAVLDRSVWSLVAYNIRKRPEHRSLIYELGKSMFKRRFCDETNCTLIFLETDPETSFCREDGHTIHSHRSLGEVSQEAQVYQWLVQNLEQDGFNVVRIPNNDISKEEFLNLVEQTAGITS
jgi:thymidylate kinase